ncbi:MAG: thiamine diphosphokinase [Smithellaceae bacterium]|nr:thiamine diphosphokinase [Smithellaceae bacterium]
MAKVVFIVSGGAISTPGFIPRQIASAETIGMICADGGGRHLYELGIVPDVVVGDMDSLPEEILRHFVSHAARVVRHPAAKNETDTELALREAFNLKPDEVRILGALGKRIDHSLANISLLMLGVKSGIPVRLIDPWCEVFLVSGRYILEGEPGQTVSIFPHPERAQGITLEGFEYLLEDSTMEMERPYGISNRLVASRAVISVTKGCLLVVRFFKPGVFPMGD